MTDDRQRLRRWLLLIYRVPQAPPGRRTYVWRQLRQLGAVYLQQAAAILERGPEARVLAVDRDPQAVEAAIQRLGRPAPFLRQRGDRQERVHAAELTDFDQHDRRQSSGRAGDRQRGPADPRHDQAADNTRDEPGYRGDAGGDGDAQAKGHGHQKDDDPRNGVFLDVTEHGRVLMHGGSAAERVRTDTAPCRGPGRS